MLSCREVSRLYARGELGKDGAGASLRQRILARIHLAMCDHCSRYIRELELIAAAVRDQFGRLISDRSALDRLGAAIRDRVRNESSRLR
ncbi:MAG TPA: hypothetical protein VI383_01505 [Gemmatimonadales bacterium]|nr:hypothetical protein [Gemmatimonadales bacterium]